ncbi:hypothetical protein RB195_022201 [Necator americanus]|uniref:CCHC-type domain-containing protein n=1 Tax=Necator americanus TaxID=51031 RepID=A0ABR1EF12_NECAM
MEKFSEAVDRLDNKTQSLPEIIERIETNTTAAQTLLDNTNKALARLIRLQEELEFDQEQRSLNRNIDNLFKFNYLLDALEGDAEESVKHFEVSGSTYQLVIEHLKEKYGDKEALIDQLLKNRHGARARTDSLEDQEALCERLHSINSQLTLKGEHVDNVFLQKKLLAKFSVDVQRHILRQKTQLKNEGNWSTAALLSAAREHIKTELKINRQVEHSLGSGKMEKTYAGKKKYLSKTEVIPRVAPCFYCHKSGHPAKDCDEVTSREQRVQIMRMQNLCHNCGGKDHWATKCPKGTCRICRQARHHTSICKELFSPQEARQKSPLREVPQKQGTKPQLPKAKTSKINTVAHRMTVLILAGQAIVLNPTTKALEPVYVILDTGADRSFISSSSAERLQLKDVDSSRLNIGTFGAHKPFERTCGITVLRMWDAEGVPHTFTVTKIDTITKPLTRSRLSQEDKQFLFENDTHLSINHTVEKIQPDILLGCADLFPLLKEGPGAQTTLPSGLKAIPSRLGYLISGRSGEELTWEQFCEFEKSGVKEFSGPITEELKQTNGEVWKAFEETIEKIEDGLRKNPNLQQYDDTIKSQLELGVIEEVAEDLIVEEGEVVHYLAHQAVVTPHKETTKLHVVSDVSAHLSNSPSLNDLLYQGPVILPKMWDILFRFRFGDAAIISDVEKAFLQVRLHPKDRNATRTHVDDQLAKEIEDNTYVDNLIVTKRSSDEGLRFYNDSKVVFKELNMNLRELQSNDKQLKKRITSADLAGNNNPKFPGILWNTEKDELVLSCNYPPKAKVAKRMAGWLTPLMLTGKRFFQSLWKFDYAWDTEISEEHQQQWKDINQAVNGFYCVLPREVAQIDTPTKLVLFSDASGQAMATCAYLASTLGGNLLAGKSKLPPITDIETIPKLELNAATMATRVATQSLRRFNAAQGSQK